MPTTSYRLGEGMRDSFPRVISIEYRDGDVIKYYLDPAFHQWREDDGELDKSMLLLRYRDADKSMEDEVPEEVKDEL